ncbi:hypothetical protein ACIQD2_14340 [Dietzia maris]
MDADDWNADAFTDPPVTVNGPDRPVSVSRAIWEDATDDLHDTIRRADDLRRLFGDAAQAAGDLDAEGDQ